MLGSRLHGEQILLMCDNMTAIFCIKNFGSRDVLHDVLTKKIDHLAKVHCFTIDIKYVQSKSNISDKVSRKFLGKMVHTEWTLDKVDFLRIRKLALSPTSGGHVCFTIQHSTVMFHVLGSL